MTGNNSMNLNHATMIAAVQMYLDSLMHAAPKVTSVKREGNSYEASFVIELTDREPTAAGK